MSSADAAAVRYDTTGEMERIEAMLARSGSRGFPQGRLDEIEAWVECGRRPWWWQLLHRRPAGS